MTLFPRRLVFLAVAATTVAGSLRAHDAGLSVASVRVAPTAVELTVSYALADVRRMLPPYSLPAGADASPESLRAARALLDPLAARLWEIRSGEAVLEPQEVRVELLAGDNLAFHLRYRRPGAAKLGLTGRAMQLGQLLPTHRELVKATDEHGASLVASSLTRDQPSVLVPPVVPSARPGGGAERPGFGTFFRLGVAHIWTGYDHLLFLFALLVAARGFKSVAVIIGCFTLAHSLTLGAATLGWVRVPPAVVEPLIAASIVFVGIENLFRRGAEPRGRGWLTFWFGLIHGFGFASVLQDLGVGSRGAGLAVPLFSFNLGVEAGQMVVAGLLLPVLFALFRSEPVRRRGGAVASALVSAAGLYWLAARTLFA
ncbi:MAG: HupE/UreJ family protein [Opitutae bacterium]|nr:HupE/UreJ family protein [Opitutae bacterium]